MAKVKGLNTADDSVKKTVCPISTTAALKYAPPQYPRSSHQSKSNNAENIVGVTIQVRDKWKHDFPVPVNFKQDHRSNDDKK
jgi:hypothetical protein